ncbi:MAG TPA: hypothetical protein VGD01_08910 [Candidatus Elarobacter sp.]|jgi:hypothetical protein
MRTTGSARFAALSVLAAVAGAAALGLAALAHAGFHVCAHHVAQADAHVHALAGRAMAHGAPPPLAGEETGLCPVVLYAAAVAAALSLLALVSLLASRASAPAALVAAAGLVSRVRLGPLTGLLGALGIVPLAAIVLSEGVPSGLPAAGALAALVAGAFLGAVALAGCARVVLAFARRLAVAIAAAFRLLVPGADAPWTPHCAPGLVPAGVRLARRRPSRAPPSLRL